MGVPVFPFDASCSLESCPKKSDKHGYHALNCAGSDTTSARHNYMRDAIFNVASKAGLAPKKEQAGLFDEDNQCPGDVLFLNWSRRKNVALDVKVVNLIQDFLALHLPLRVLPQNMLTTPSSRSLLKNAKQWE